MPSLLNIIDSNNRIKYEQLVNFIDNCPLSTFTDQAQFPFFVGKELYEGDIRKRKTDKAGSVSESTMMFRPAINPDDIRAISGKEFARNQTSSTTSAASGISHAIYSVRKKLYSTSEKNVISIGRSRDNDIVIADYVISKHHAQIITFHDMFFIVDLSSTNGTQVNREKVKPHMKIQMELNSTVAFGRFVFVFMTPLELYKSLRRKSLR